MKRHSSKHGRYCFKVALIKEKYIKYVLELVIMFRKKRAQIESLAIYRKNNSKKNSNISIKEILGLFSEIEVY